MEHILRAYVVESLFSLLNLLLVKVHIQISFMRLFPRASVKGHYYYPLVHYHNSIVFRILISIIGPIVVEFFFGWCLCFY